MEELNDGTLKPARIRKSVLRLGWFSGWMALAVLVSIAGVLTLSRYSLAQGTANVGNAKKLTVQEARGKHLFLQNCSLCHLSTYSKLPDWKESTNTPRPIGPSLAGELDDGGAGSEKIVRLKILNGTTHMPGFKYALNAKQIDDLIAYMKTQKKGE